MRHASIVALPDLFVAGSVGWQPNIRLVRESRKASQRAMGRSFGILTHCVPRRAPTTSTGAYDGRRNVGSTLPYPYPSPSASHLAIGNAPSLLIPFRSTNPYDRRWIRFGMHCMRFFGLRVQFRLFSLHIASPHGLLAFKKRRADKSE